jgi:hypothetical protein
VAQEPGAGQPEATFVLVSTSQPYGPTDFDFMGAVVSLHVSPAGRVNDSSNSE